LRINSLVILVCIAASLWAWQQDPKFVEQNVIFSFNNLLNGRPWTLLVSPFVHGSVLHLFGNMLFLFVFGGTLERSIGAGKYLSVFLTGGIAGFLLTVPFAGRDAGIVGASGAIFTIAACVMLVRPLKFSWLFLAPQGLVAILYFLWNVIVVYDPTMIRGYDPQVGYITHVIGFVIGIPFGVAWSKEWKKNLVITVVLLAIYVTILTIVIGFLSAPDAASLLSY
jgi:membrane associated rhomboid family serine protease